MPYCFVLFFYYNADLSVSPAPFAVLEQFEQVSILSLSKIIQHMKPTSCPLDTVPTKLLK